MYDLAQDIKYKRNEVARLRKAVMKTRLTYMLYLALLIMNCGSIYAGTYNIGTGISMGVVVSCWLFMIFTNETNMIDYRQAKRHLRYMEQFELQADNFKSSL